MVSTTLMIAYVHALHAGTAAHGASQRPTSGLQQPKARSPRCRHPQKHVSHRLNATSMCLYVTQYANCDSFCGLRAPSRANARKLVCHNAQRTQHDESRAHVHDDAKKPDGKSLACCPLFRGRDLCQLMIECFNGFLTFSSLKKYPVFRRTPMPRYCHGFKQSAYYTYVCTYYILSHLTIYTTNV